jgi:hypothetical protein
MSMIMRERCQTTFRVSITIALAACLFSCGCEAPKTSPSVNFDSLTVSPENRPEGADFEQGRAILEASRRAYSSISSYDGTIELSTKATFPGETHPQQRTLKVHYQRPGNLRLEGRNSNDDPFVIEITPDSASIRRKDEIENFPSGKDALVAFSGATLYSSLVLPGCLLDVAWGNEDWILPRDKSLFDAWATKARLDGSASVDGRGCQRIVCERDTMTWTIYVDEKTKLLCRVDVEISERNMERLKEKGASGGFSGRLLGIERSQVFSIDEVTWTGDAPK